MFSCTNSSPCIGKLIVLLAFIFNAYTLQVGFSSADYQIGVAVQSIEFLEPQNTLADGSCCDSGCGDDATCCAAASCSPTLRLCFRKSQHPTDDRDSPCLVQISREDGDEPFFSLSTDSPAAAGYYTVSWISSY